MRIPFGEHSSVFNNLVHATRIHVARAGMSPLILDARIPQNVEDWALAFRDMFSGIGVPDDEVLFFWIAFSLSSRAALKGESPNTTGFHGGLLSKPPATPLLTRHSSAKG